jgi:hypothetical protein
MNKKHATRRRFAAACGIFILVFAAMYSGQAAYAGDGEPDYLVLNPENE